MGKPIHLFVSSSPELVSEREIIGQIIATMPMTIGWRIGHTPLPGSSSDDRALWVEECDLYAVILGHDFSAPMGEELGKVLNKRLGGAAQIEPMAFWFKCTPSPSAQNTIHHVRLKWLIYDRLDRFETMFKMELIRNLLKQASRLELSMGDLAGLALTLEHLKKEVADRAGTEKPDQEPGPYLAVKPDSTDAGQGGVILGREVLERSGLRSS